MGQVGQVEPAQGVHHAPQERPGTADAQGPAQPKEAQPCQEIVQDDGQGQGVLGGKRQVQGPVEGVQGTDLARRQHRIADADLGRPPGQAPLRQGLRQRHSLGMIDAGDVSRVIDLAHEVTEHGGQQSRHNEQADPEGSGASGRHERAPVDDIRIGRRLVPGATEQHLAGPRVASNRLSANRTQAEIHVAGGQHTEQRLGRAPVEAFMQLAHRQGRVIVEDKGTKDGLDDRCVWANIV
jgi:hypothetical protein